MISLKKCVIFSAKAQRIRNIYSFVRPITTENFVNVQQCKTLFVRLISSEIISRLQKCNTMQIQTVQYSSDARDVTQLDYEKFCVETLDGLSDYIEELIESVNHLATADVVNKDGVLTASLGSKYGTYVINKQSPNKQIWLSSPTSGPKRFDFVYAADDNKNGYWIYKHTGETLHEILDREFTEIVQNPTKFQSLTFGSRC